ncbi:MAG: hypothetical protein K2R98_29960 [Gemmataceae bacterium]|nr:hypothetical protein [Gemmataceae bacterium]
MSLFRGVDRWLFSYLAEIPQRRPPRQGEDVHLLLCVCDHYEPKGGHAPTELARARVRRWVEEYPRSLGAFRDSDGRPPQHTFFYPAEEYEPELLDGLASLCRGGFGEAEVHLHHDHDTADDLRHKLLAFKDTLAEQHGLLARRRDTGEAVYAFIHGNWALNNSRPDGRWCGVNDEITVLRQTGCYADFTLPSAPSPTQTRTINRIYYARSEPRRPKAHDTGTTVCSKPAPSDALLLIPGPLLLDWQRRKWGILPGIENGCLQASQPPTARRLDLWLRARVQVPTRPDWFFAKLYAHGAPEVQADMLLGEPARQFHQALAQRAASDPHFHFHYVTAREMYNLARAAEAGHSGHVDEARDFELLGPRVARRVSTSGTACPISQ